MSSQSLQVSLYIQKSISPSFDNKAFSNLTQRKQKCHGMCKSLFLVNKGIKT